MQQTPISDELSAAQQDRRDRILAATRALALAGGYDGVQMRDVAVHADVALGTLYRYFPSKVQLLVALMRAETERLTARMDAPVAGATAAERVMTVLGRGLRALRAQRELTEAMTRALQFADASSASDLDAITSLTTRMITSAMAGADRTPTPDDAAIARVIEQVWLSSLQIWLTGRTTAEEMDEDVRVAVRLLLR